MCGAATFVDSGRQMTHKCYNICSAVEMLTTYDGPTVDAKARYWSKIMIFTLLEYCHNIGMEKMGMVWLKEKGEGLSPQ